MYIPNSRDMILIDGSYSNFQKPEDRKMKVFKVKIVKVEEGWEIFALDQNGVDYGWIDNENEDIEDVKERIWIELGEVEYIK